MPATKPETMQIQFSTLREMPRNSGMLSIIMLHPRDVMKASMPAAKAPETAEATATR